jgi:hypothetical protein
LSNLEKKKKKRFDLKNERTSSLGLSQVINLNLEGSSIDIVLASLVGFQVESVVEGQLANATLDSAESDESLLDTRIGSVIKLVWRLKNRFEQS